MGNQLLSTGLLFSAPNPWKENIMINIKFKKVLIDTVLLLLLCTVHLTQTTLQHLFIPTVFYSEKSKLIPQI